jgi:hypothetical protein
MLFPLHMTSKNRKYVKMVKSGSDRANKYASKVDSSVVKSRIDAQKTSMIAGNANAMAITAGIQGQVRVILDATPAIATTFSQPFMACALQLNKIATRFTGQNKQNEGTYALAKWDSRLSVISGAHAKLILIAGLFGITYA